MGLRDMAAPAGVAAGASQASSPETAPGVELPTVESPAPTQPDEPNHAGGEVDAAAVEQVFDFCLQQIYGGKSPEGDLNPHVAEMLRSGEDPTDSLADTAATVVSSAAMKHEGVTGDVLAVAMFGVIAELADASREVGLYEYSEEEMEDATINAKAELIENTRNIPGVWDTEEATNDFNQLMAMNESGNWTRCLRVSPKMARQRKRRLPVGLADIVGGTLRGVGAGITTGARLAVHLEGERLRNAFMEKQLQARERMHSSTISSRERIAGESHRLRQMDIENRNKYYTGSLDERRRRNDLTEEQLIEGRIVKQGKLYDDMVADLEDRDFKYRQHRDLMKRHQENLDAKQEKGGGGQGGSESKTGLTDNQTLSS